MLAALAAAVISVPVLPTFPAFAQQLADAVASSSNEKPAKEIEVSASRGLEKAITEATDFLKTNEGKTVLIKVKVASTQELPWVVNAKGKIIVEGINNDPAGVGGKDDAQRTTLRVKSQGTLHVYSPLELRGFALSSQSGQFNVINELKVSNSVIRGGGVFPDPIFHRENTTDDSGKMIVEHTSFKDRSIIRTREGFKHF